MSNPDSDSQTRSDDSSLPPQVEPPGAEDQLQKWREQLLIGHQAMAMNHLNLDRCLLRRDLKARQNERYGLPQENLPECEDSAPDGEEDDMGVRVGDNIITNTHNHYTQCPPEPECPDQPTQPIICPPERPKLPWWLISLLVLPWMLLACGLVWWLLNNWGDDGSTRPIIGWQLDVGTDPSATPVPQPQPVPVPGGPSTQPVPEGPSIQPVPEGPSVQPVPDATITGE